MTRPGFTILAVDPGLTGALASYETDAPNIVAVHDMPVAGDHVDPAALARLIREIAPDIAVVELVGSMPKQGVSSTFKFGCGYGMVQGVIAALCIPVHLVTPGKWKRYFRLTADKEKARAAAIRLWPSCDQFSRKKDAGRAEAALIARYAFETFPSIRGSAPASEADRGEARPGGGDFAIVGKASQTSSPRAPEVPA